MAHWVPGKMSLMAQFDDLCRYTNILATGCEAEFKMFVESQLNLKRQYDSREAEMQKLKEKLARRDAEICRIETQLKHCRDLVDCEVKKRAEVEKEKKVLQNQINIIKEVLLSDVNMDNQTKEKLAFLSSNCNTNVNGSPRLTTIEESAGSLFSDEDLTADTLEECEQRKSSRGKRHSKEKRSRDNTSPKRLRNDNTETSDTTESDNVHSKPIAVRSSSEPAPKTPDIARIKQYHRSDSDQSKYHTYDLRRTNTGSLSHGTPVGRYSTGGKLSRSHKFVTKTIIRTERCQPCGTNVKFCQKALKCEDCRIICHPECQDKCPLPCVPVVNTPTKGSVGSIADYTHSTTPPMIPSIIVHCLNEIEQRGFKEIGLYRISGSDREVKELKEKFLKSRTIPCLNQVDIHAICGTVKEFLRSLKEPLIPRAAWSTMVEAAQFQNEQLSLNALFDAVNDFPAPNRDTLAFMIMHLQRVAESPYCKMNIDNLAKVFGPTIVGYSTAEPTDVLVETRYQHNIMYRLLSIPSESWHSLLNIEKDVFYTPTPVIHKTPETTPAPKATRLGPVYAGQRPKTLTLKRTPLTPRNPKSSHRSGRMEFSSPFLK